VSVRNYSGPYADRRRGRSAIVRAVPWLLAAITIGLEIAYPLVHDQNRRLVIVATVVAFFLASTSHALVWRGVAWTLGYLAVTVGGGLLVEVIGLNTGVPFGNYVYTGGLSSLVFGVPWVIPLAWAMFAYPCLVVARRVSRNPAVVPIIAAVALASWDLFLDPMMVAEGYWKFSDIGRVLPHVTNVPALNFVGWFITSLVMMAVLDRLPRRIVPDGQPGVLFLWTFFSSVLANAMFFNRGWVAFYGGVVMGIVAVPYLWALWVGRD